MKDERVRPSGSRAAGWFWAVFGTVWVLVAVVAYADATALRNRGVETDGTVVVSRPKYVTVEFETRDGRKVRADVENVSRSPDPDVGDVIRVLYDPRDPKVVADAGAGPDYVKVWLTGALGLVSAVVAGLTFRGRIDWNRRR